MTTVDQAVAYTHRVKANASPFRVIVVAHAKAGGTPFPDGWNPSRWYSVELAVEYEGQLHRVKRLGQTEGTTHRVFDRKPDAKAFAVEEALARGVYYETGLWTSYGSPTGALIKARAA